ncbi:Pancreatic secretory granule membrane major glyco GP2 [Paramuricea clavata]|uniref:Pancreatic secretory granule membrane major glyco GP2 n=1 Tax=Paramuricea clavata TaxID=317549 RepID=A0A6S7GH88_PARCT|nr:Pancreatic secretory granule membrane major glyco GP2 [Paramuricea clavata]
MEEERNERRNTGRKDGWRFCKRKFSDSNEESIVKSKYFLHTAFIEERIGLGSYSVPLYHGYQNVLPCHSYGYPAPYIAWVSNGVVLQNRTSDQDTNLVVIANGTKGTTTDYECWASNIHGKDLYSITASHTGRYDMCIKPEEVRDPSRNRFSKQDTTKAIQNDKDSFDASKMYSFFNPLSSLYMKLTTSCPPPSSCGTGAPGWLPDGHPKPEDGIVRRKVCFHYDGNCCYKALYIDVTNCPGMYVYGLVNTVLDFAARYCFEDDKKNEAFAPFRSVPLLFAPVGGSNTALVNHVIAKDDGIEDTSQCLIVCMMNKCRSLNFDKLNKICEVNDVTKDEYPRDLSAKPGFQYYHPMGQPVVVNKGRN